MMLRRGGPGGRKSTAAWRSTQRSDLCWAVRCDEDAILLSGEELSRAAFTGSNDKSAARHRLAGLLQSPLTDSNRRPPPYHGGSQAVLAYRAVHSRARFSCKSSLRDV